MDIPNLLPQIIERDGFAILPPVLDDAELDALTQALSAPGLYARRDVLGAPLVRESCAGALGEVARQVLGEGARPVRGLLFDKVPGKNWKVPWHQDLTIAVREKHEAPGFGPWSVKEGVPHVQPPVQVLEGMVALRLHLDACPRENGALRVLPGTHTRGKMSAEQIQHERQGTEEQVCEAKRGEILLMKPLLLHASSSSEAPSHRRVLHIEWAARGLDEPLRYFYG